MYALMFEDVAKQIVADRQREAEKWRLARDARRARKSEPRADRSPTPRFAERFAR